jgi:hypothetical protein
MKVGLHWCIKQQKLIGPLSTIILHQNALQNEG